MLKIYGRPNSINVRKVLWLVEEIGLPYEREDWGRNYRSTDDPAFLALNPVGLVPVIDDDGFVMTESNAIIRYLAAKHDRTDLFPADPRARATVDRWMDWQATTVHSAWMPAFHGLVVKAQVAGGAEAIEASVKAWNRQMGILDNQLVKAGGYVAADRFTLADIPVGLVVNRWFMTPIERSDHPAVAAYYERLSERPAYRSHGRNGMP